MRPSLETPTCSRAPCSAKRPDSLSLGPPGQTGTRGRGYRVPKRCLLQKNESLSAFDRQAPFPCCAEGLAGSCALPSGLGIPQAATRRTPVPRIPRGSGQTPEKHLERSARAARAGVKGGPAPQACVLAPEHQMISPPPPGALSGIKPGSRVAASPAPSAPGFPPRFVGTKAQATSDRWRWPRSGTRSRLGGPSPAVRPVPPRGPQSWAQGPPGPAAAPRGWEPTAPGPQAGVPTPRPPRGG